MRLIGLVVLLAFATPTLAQEGMYVGLGLSSFDYSEDAGFLAPEAFSDTVSAWKAYGGFEFGEHVGVEIRYGATGKIETTSAGTDPTLGDYTAAVSTDFKITSALVLGVLPKDWGALFGGVGYFNSTGKARLTLDTACCGVFNPTASANDNGLTAALGVEWRFGRFDTGVALRLEYEWLDFENGNASTLGIGVAYRF